jgi:hypothetical protein
MAGTARARWRKLGRMDPERSAAASNLEAVVLTEHVVQAEEATLTVTDHRVRIHHTGSHRPIELDATAIRRIQLDLEVGRPAMLAIVPNSGVEAPTVVTVAREHFAELSAAILHLAVDLDDVRR